MVISEPPFHGGIRDAQQSRHTGHLSGQNTGADFIFLRAPGRWSVVGSAHVCVQVQRSLPHHSLEDRDLRTHCVRRVFDPVGSCCRHRGHALRFSHACPSILTSELPAIKGRHHPTIQVKPEQFHFRTNFQWVESTQGPSLTNPYQSHDCNVFLEDTHTPPTRTHMNTCTHIHTHTPF